MKERRGAETKPAPTTTHNTTHSRMPTSQPQSRLITLSCCSYSRAESGSFRQHIDRPSWLFLAVTCRTSSASFTQHRQHLSPFLCTIGYLTLYIITNTTPPIPSLESRSVFSLKLYSTLVCTESVATSYHSALVRTFFFVLCTL